MNNQKKALLVALAVAGVSISGPMVKWSLSCGASPVMVAFGRMAISFLLLLVPALRSGELQAVLRAPKKQVALACAAGLLLALHYTCWMTSLSFASTFVSTALVCTQPLFVAALSGVLLHEPIKREAVPGAVVAVVGNLVIQFAFSGVHAVEPIEPPVNLIDNIRNTISTRHAVGLIVIGKCRWVLLIGKQHLIDSIGRC